MEMQNLLLRQAENARQRINTNDIPGWGMDADPENDPTYPMKARDPEVDHAGLNYEKAPQQTTDIEVFHSIERPSITRVFGTSTPPKGLSGKIRAKAFEYSEATAAHWMMLILADRVDVVQGLAEDIRNGHIPNILEELGWRAEWEFNRKKFVGKIAAYTIGTAVFFMMLRRKRKSHW